MIVALKAGLRTSGGGQAFLEQMGAALSRAPSVQRTLTLRSTQRSSLLTGLVPRHQQTGDQQVDVVLCPGNTVVRLSGAASVLWPLTVAPFDPNVKDLVRARLHGRQRAAALLRLRLQARLIRTHAACADALVFSSRYAHELYTQQLDISRTPSTVLLPAPVLLQSAGPSDDLARFDWSRDQFFLFVSHLYPYKMVVELVRAFALAVLRLDEPHHLVLAGAPVDRHYAAQIEQAARSEGIADRVHLLGAVEPVVLSALYRRSRCFVFPSLCENAGSYALLDAMSHGSSVVCSSLSSMPEVCGEAVLYADPRRPDEFADRMVEVATDPVLGAALGRAALRRAAELPDWDGIAHRLLAFLATLRSLVPSQLAQGG